MQVSLRTRLITLCVAIVALAVITVATANFVTTRHNAEKLLTQQSTEIAQAHAQALHQWYLAKQRTVTSLKAHAQDENIVPALQSAVVAAQFDQAYIGLPDRSFRFSENRPRAADYDPTKRAWYMGAVAAGGASVTEPFIGASTGKLIITFSELVGTPSNVTAVVAGDVMLDNMIKSISSIRPTPNSFAALISNSGKLIAYQSAEMALKPLTDLHPDLTPQSIAAHKDPLSRTWRVGGRDAYLFAQPVPGTNWQLLVMMDESDVTEALRSILFTSVLTTVLITLLAAGVLYAVISRVLARLQHVRNAIQAAGDGNFTTRLQATGSDELTHIAHAYNRFADSVSDTLHRMRQTSRFVETASSEIAAGNQDLSVRTEQQADALSLTVASIDKIMGTVRSNADNASQANALALSASHVAERGGSVVSNVVITMDAISASSRRIADIIGVIDSIAFQTNILALNAAVEAARAGEQGRGFAVVATEVRQLAQRSASAAREIRTLIQESVEKVQGGSQLVQNAGTTMDEIVHSVQRVVSIMGEITAASQEQTRDIEQISHAIVRMEDGTQQNTALVEQASAAAASLQEQAAQLARMVSAFELRHESASNQGTAPSSQGVLHHPHKPALAQRDISLLES